MSKATKSVAMLAALLLASSNLAPQAFADSPVKNSSSADSDPTVSELVIHSQFDARNSVEVVLTFDAPVAVSVLEAQLDRQGDDTSNITVQGATGKVNRRGTVKSTQMTTARASAQGVGEAPIVNGDSSIKPSNNSNAKPQAPGQPAAANLQCNRFYSYSNFDGSYTIQRACASQYGPWGLTLSAYWRGHAVGTVSERGLDWKLNGANRPRQSPHLNYLSNYIFHGRYSGIKDGYNVSYQDVISFRHNIGPGGNAALTFMGDHSFLGEDGSTCQPGKPC